ncbi:MAG TPA: glycosyltransferase family 9 protein [Bacteroidales bacterium]|nr:glycosyltransferase family 9 protein [Bacteroidales bacterium]
MIHIDSIQRLIISRTDAMGDVVLCLPLAGYLKQLNPSLDIVFLGRTYTRPILESCQHTDGFLNWDVISQMAEREAINALKEVQADAILHVFPRREIAELARKAGIPHRIGTSGRLFHWKEVNHRVRFSRRRSSLHEAQLNFRLLEPVGIKHIPSTDEIRAWYGLSAPSIELPIDRVEGRKLIILHPGSRGSAREWGLMRFAELIWMLREERYDVFLTGTEEEGLGFRDMLVKPYPHVTDVSGMMDLPMLMAFIASADALVAASTGPLHLAAALGIKAIGIYPPIRPMHPGRWAPLGADAHALVLDKTCNSCRRRGPCRCMEDIDPASVKQLLDA